LPRIIIAWINSLSVVFILVTSPYASTIRLTLSTPNLTDHARLNQASETDLEIYLPVILKYSPLPPPIFGVETENIGNPDILEKAIDANVYWIRSDVISWEIIEPTRKSPPVYNWNQVNGQALIDATSQGLKVIATIKFAPDWAQKYEGVSCGPIAEDQLSAFGEFLHELVTIYGSEPYNVKYWELGNEPDIDHRIPDILPDNPYGCWGEDAEDYYGGEYYADMLKVAYPAIKSADSEAVVSIGGLLLDCDPTHPPPEKTCKSAKFLEGILLNDGADYFDIVSFHGYPRYYECAPPQCPYVSKLYDYEHHPYWAHRGGVILGKADFIQEVLASHEVTKPLFPSESALLCPEQVSGCNPVGDSFYQAQADFVIWLFVRNWAEGFLGTTWFTLEGPGWRNVGLLEKDYIPRPAYNTLSFITQELSNTLYRWPITFYYNIRGYEFGNDQKRVWVLWSSDEQNHTISLPVGVLRIFDKFGDPIEIPLDGRITVNSPIYVELNQ